jgi:hypothetical protein
MTKAEREKIRKAKNSKIIAGNGHTPGKVDVKRVVTMIDRIFRNEADT